MAKAVKSVIRALPQIAITFAVTWATGGLSVAYWAAAAVAASAAVGGLLTRTPKFSGMDRANNVSLASGAEPQNVIYGQARVRTLRVFAASSPAGGLDNGYLHQVLALARTDADGVEEIGDIYLGDEVVPLVAEGEGWAPVYGHRLEGALYIQKLTGAAEQEAPAMLVSAGVGWTAQHKLEGVAALYVRMLWDKKRGPDVWPDGLPPVTAVVKGQKVYDPRTGSKAWSANFALCVRDFLRADYGYASAPEEVDEAALIAAANLCDEEVDLSPYALGGATQARYTANISLDLDGPPGDAVDRLLAAGMATLSYTRGCWRLFPAAYQAPPPGGLVLTADHLRGAPTIDMDPPRQDLANCVKGRFVAPDQGWVATDFPTVEDAALIAADGERLEMDIDLAPVTDAARAQRLAKIALRRSRRGTVQWPGNWACLTLRVGDSVPVSLSALGWDQKPFLVETWELSSEGGVDLLLREIVAADYAWTAAEEQAVPVPDRTNLPDPAVVSAPAGLTAVADTRVLADGSVLPVIVVSVLGSSDADARDMLVRWRLATETEWQVRILPASATTTEITVLDGATYAVAAAAQNARGVTSAWTAAQLVTVAGGVIGARVVRLELFEQGGDTTFEGRDVRIVWSGSFPDTGANFAAEPFGAGTAQANPYWRGYVVRVYDADTGALLRTEAPQTASAYTYSYEDNARDGGPRRRLTFAVSILPKVGAEMGTATLTVSNSAPGLPADLLVAGVTLGVRIAYTPPQDNDWVGIRVYMAADLPIPIDDAHLVYSGPDTDITLPLPAGAIRYVQVAQVDAFGPVPLILSPAVQVTARAVVTADLAQNIIGTDQLTPTLSSRIALVDGPPTLAGSVASQIQQERAAWTEVTGAVASRTTTLEQTVTNPATGLAKAHTRITDEAQVRVSEVGAVASRTNTLEATVSDPTTGLAKAHTRITDEAQVRVSEVGAVASRTTTLEATVSDPTTGLAKAHTRITDEAQARVDAVGAVALRTSTLEATVSDPTTGLAKAHAAVATEALARADADGKLSAQYTVKVDVNGRVAGFGLASAPVNGAVVSHFAVVSDKFSIALPSDAAGVNRYIFTAGTDPGTGQPAVVINGAFYAGTIGVNQIRAGTLDAGVVYAGTVNASQIRGGSISGQTLSMAVDDAGVYIDGSARNILVRTGPNAADNRVAMGKVGGQYGLWVWNAEGKAIFAASELGVEVVGGANIKPNSITNSAQSAGASGSLTSIGDTTVASVAITHNGRRVRLEVTGSGTVVTRDTNATTKSGRISVRLYRGGSEIAYFGDLVYRSGVDYLDDTGYAGGSLACTYLDTPPGTTATYDLILNRNGGSSVSYSNVRLVVTALLTES